jgi:putative transposase
MPQSHARVVLHIVFSTKNRVPFLKNAGVRERLHAYMAGVLNKISCEVILINGTDDHVHILCNQSRTITIANLIKEAKVSPSEWMKELGPQYRNFFWQGGYAAFSVSESNVEKVRAYISSQEEHHRKVSFQDEFRALCKKHGLQIDEKYVWD